MARLDIRENGFRGNTFHKTFLEVRIFNANSPSYRNTKVAACYKRQEQEKQRKYEQRIRQVEHESFTPIVFTRTGGCSHITTTYVKRLASLLAEKTDTPYSTTVNWVICRIGFALLRAAEMCLRGSYQDPIKTCL